MKLADFWEVFSRIPCFGKFSVTSHTRLSTTPHHTTLCGGTENGLKVSSSKQRKTGQVSTPSISRCPPKHSVLLNRHIFSPPVCTSHSVHCSNPCDHLSVALALVIVHSRTVSTKFPELSRNFRCAEISATE